ncbi:MAG: hypothetical protein JWN86_2246 [Planctomycetota bacterium]|nr:hypothetical protein [Planctomycetota bacterium]
MEDHQTTPGQVPFPPPAIRPSRIWSIALGAAVFAALVAWGVEEASLRYYGSHMTVKSAPRGYRPDLRAPNARELAASAATAPPRGNAPARRRDSIYGASRATIAYQQEFTAKAVALSGAAVGVMFGLALGLAIALAGGPAGRSWIQGAVVAILGAAVCGVLGWLTSRSLVPMFYLARIDNPGSTLVIASLLLIRGVPRMIAGLAGGLALGVAVGGGRPRMALGALGGLIGAAIGVALVVVGDELIALLASHNEIATSPILHSPVRRVAAILAVSVPSAVGAAWSILTFKPRPDEASVGSFQTP